MRITRTDTVLRTPIRSRDDDAVSTVAYSTHHLLDCVAGACGEDDMLSFDRMNRLEVMVEEHW